jgi:NAD(P)-dependent dehydrogenase (short-subunit alcohol dehydrogenase family)
LKGQWALILGASSGFGAATAKALAKTGMNILGVHLDTRATLPVAEQVKAEVQALGVKVLFFNTNAADPQKRQEVLDAASGQLNGAHIQLLLHSLAFGTLKPYIAVKSEDSITQKQMEMTLDVMAHSLVYWTQDLVRRKLMDRGGRIFAMTSGGSNRVIPFYGAVSAAKACLESHIRQLASELAPYGITANAIRAGVTDTPALRKIPGHEKLLGEAQRRNPSGRTTTPEDVAQAIVALCQPSTYWITGNVINVDGGEEITA